jgi:DNA-binding GntR family transcriptional regulator
MLHTSILTASSRNRNAKESLNAVAYQQIRDMIVRLELPPASVIDENALTEELNIGLTPIRQALRRLALENLVVILPRRGTLVADLNMSDLQKIFEIRIELEALAAQLAAERALPDQIAAMENLLAQLDQIRSSGEQSYDRLIEIDHEAHQLLAEAAHNEFLAATLSQLYSHVLRLWYVSLDKVSRLEEAIEEHRAIIAAVKRKDSTEAAEIMRQHVRGFQQAFATLL